MEKMMIHDDSGTFLLQVEGSRVRGMERVPKPPEWVWHAFRKIIEDEELLKAFEEWYNCSKETMKNE